MEMQLLVHYVKDWQFTYNVTGHVTEMRTNYNGSIQVDKNTQI